MTRPNRLNQRRDPFDRQLRRAVRELVELVRQYEAGELPEAQAEVVRRWVGDRGD